MMQQQNINIEINVPIRMRDGTVLYADVYHPDNSGPCPVLLTRMPYDKSEPVYRVYFDPMRAAKNGYVVVVQDCRGTMTSEGEFYPFREVNDGYDTVEWVAAQPWSNGKVGMYGISYFALTQWRAAVEQPPHLVTIFPGQVMSDLHDDMIYPGGAFQFALLDFCLIWMSFSELAKLNLSPKELLKLKRRIINAVDNDDEQKKFLPLKELPVLRETGLTKFYFDFLEHPDNNQYWQQFKWNLYEKVKIPIYHMTGWYDVALGGTLANYMGMKERGGSELARKNQRLIVGPWLHSPRLTFEIGQLETGLASMDKVVDYQGIQLRWFDYWLKGINNGIMDEPPVRIFVLGDNEWRLENEWPLARTQYTKYYFHSDGRANTLSGDGTLNTEPSGDEEYDSYVYDPRNPVPTKGGNWLGRLMTPVTVGAFDQRGVEERPDVLVYTTAPLEKDLEITGPILVKLYAASSARDTDFTAKLIDVWPNGEAYNIAEGIIRARYRESTAKQCLIEVGKVYQYNIDLWATSNVFKSGHRIRVDISSSNFPRFDRNPNTGHPFGQDAELEIAVQKIFHDAKRPSHIVLPVIPR